jgi:hypothetical protein
MLQRARVARTNAADANGGRVIPRSDERPAGLFHVIAVMNVQTVAG